jgi:hypothetical protein
MNIVRKVSLASALALFIAAPALAQNAQQGDYYKPGATTPQTMSPGQKQEEKQGDYYKPTGTAPQTMSPGQKQEEKQGDYYQPGGKQ